LGKPEYIFISKSDTVEKATVDKIKDDFKNIGKQVEAISIIDNESLDNIKKILNKLILEKQAKPI
jgi:ethanolamine utilization protein EutP (predicted NTPase)